jgi:hypothetical protein
MRLTTRWLEMRAAVSPKELSQVRAMPHPLDTRPAPLIAAKGTYRSELALS